MSVRATCPGCGSTLEGVNSWAGKSTSCPSCGAKAQFPPATTNSSPSSPESKPLIPPTAPTPEVSASVPRHSILHRIPISRALDVVKRRWRPIILVATATLLLIWFFSTRPFSDPYTFVNAGKGQVYKTNRRTGESWLIRGTTEIPINQLTEIPINQLTPEQELVRQQSLIEADAATKKTELETAARIQEAETERTRLQHEFAQQQSALAQAQKVEEQKRMQQQQARLQQERDQKLAADKKERAIDLARRSNVLSKALPNPYDPQLRMYSSPGDTNGTAIREMLELEKNPNLQIGGWAAEKVADDVYLVSYTYTTGTGSSKVRTGYYFEVNVIKEIVQNIFRNTERSNKYQEYGINPIPVPPLLAN